MASTPFDVRPPASGDPCEIYALKLAEATRPTGLCVFLTDFLVPIDTYFFFWCIRTSRGIVLVDTGFTARTPQSQGVRELTTPVAQLAKLGIEAEKIDRIVLSHLHWDHAGGLDFFPNARIFLQKREFEFFTEHPFRLSTPYKKVTFPEDLARVEELHRSGRLTLVDGPAEIAPGVSVMLAPGHTPGLQVTLVRTARGTAALASDCCHLFRNVREETTSCIITDMIAWLESFQRIKKAVSSEELIFPGHDAEMITRFPNVADGVSKLV